jgi:elongation factor P
MSSIGTNDIRPGMKIEINNDPYLVVNIEFIKPGKGQAFNRIKLKNILTGRVVEKTYKSGDKLQTADVVESKMRLLYLETDGAVFMDDESYEQFSVPFDVVGATRNWLKEDILFDVIFYKGTIVEVIPPNFMELKITETMPGVRGDTASGRVLKPATLETGAKVQVPIFVNEEEIIKVDTRTSEYVSRA